MKSMVSNLIAVGISCLIFSGQVKAQGGCTFITFAIENIAPCQYQINYNNSNECYPQLRVLLNEGSFIGWAANTSDGWTAISVSPTELLLTHSSGFIPIGTGTPLTFTIPQGASPLLTLLWDYSCPPGEGCFAEFQLEGCQVIADGCIEGFVYQECGELPFFNQEVLEGWTVELIDDIGNVQESIVTGSEGAYAFCDLPAGIYIVRVVGDPGWTSNVPASGQSTIELVESGFEEQNFGVCPSCSCGLFTDMFIRTGHGAPSQSLTCGNAALTLTCPLPGESFVVTGLFHCEGDSCADNAHLQWTLVGPFNSYFVPTTADPYFSITLLASYFDHSGLYTLKLNGQCGSLNCPCEIRFNIDCTDLCPCSSEDVDDFATRVERGFAILYPENSCTVCFTPLALDDCETVQWRLLSQAASTVGSSVGVRTFCYHFTEPGDDEMIMEVTRKKDDINDCDKKMKMQRVSPCQVTPDCDESFFSNSSFSEGAVAGGLISGGASQGWSAAAGDPVVTEGISGSSDGWTIALSGNLDTSDILTQIEPVCLEKIEGRVSVDAILDVLKRKNERITIHLHRGDQFNPEICNSIDCYELGSISLSEVRSDGRISIQIPFDLRDWNALDDCGGFSGVLVRPYVTITNPFGDSQGGEGTNSVVHLDNFCMEGMTVSVDGMGKESGSRIYPNPVRDFLTIELASPPEADMWFRIINFTGQMLGQKRAVSENLIQQIETGFLPGGIYFLQEMSNGHMISAHRFVKQ